MKLKIVITIKDRPVIEVSQDELAEMLEIKLKEKKTVRGAVSSIIKEIKERTNAI